MAGDHIHFVNLETPEKGPGEDEKQFGPLYWRFAFDKPAPGVAKVRIVPDAKNASYSEAERTRWSRFALQEKVGEAVKPLGCTEIDPHVALVLPAAGANRYRLEAKDAAGKVVQSSRTVITRRRVHLFPVYVPDPPGLARSTTAGDGKGPFLAALAAITAKLSADPYAIELVKVGKMPEVAVPDPTPAKLRDAVLAAVSKQTDHRLRTPGTYVAVASVPWITYCELVDVQETVRLHEGSGTIGDFTWTLRGSEQALIVNAPPHRLLWKGLGRQGCFVSALLHAMNHAVTFNSAEFARPDVGTLEGHRRFVIRLHKHWEWVERFLRARADVVLNLRFHVATGWATGSLSNGQPVLLVARSQSFEPLQAVTDAVLHELGHALGLASTGNAGKDVGYFAQHTPDRADTYYDELMLLPRGADGPVPVTRELALEDRRRLHQGPHCSAGAALGPNGGLTSQPTCVMWGDEAAAGDFCPACRAAARKVDCREIAKGFQRNGGGKTAEPTK